MRGKLIGRKLGVGLLVTFLLLFMVVAFAEEERTDASGQWKYTVTDGSATITGYTEEPNDDLVIPGELDGHPVTGIGESAFCDCGGLTSVTIPQSVTSIDAEAFGRCMSLTSVIIPDSVTSIGEWAFKDCVSLTDVIIGTNVASIGRLAFFACESLTNVSIPDSVTSIGGLAFKDCYSLTDVTIGSSVTSIGGLAFFACESLTNMTIPVSVTDIGESAFAQCEELTLTVTGGSVAEQYAKDNGIPYVSVGMAALDALEKKTDVVHHWKDVLGDGGVTITGFATEPNEHGYDNEPSGVLVIPDELGGYLVIGIGGGAFGEAIDALDSEMAQWCIDQADRAIGELINDFARSTEEGGRSGYLQILQTTLLVPGQQPADATDIEREVWQATYGDSACVVSFVFIDNGFNIDDVPYAEYTGRYGDYAVQKDGSILGISLRAIRSRYYHDPVLPGVRVINMGSHYNGIYTISANI